VFSGGFTWEAVSAVRGDADTSREEDLPALSALVDKSLLQAAPGSRGELRFSMLETIREHAYEQLERSGELALSARRHGEYFCGLAECAAPRLSSAERADWLQLLDLEMGNLRAALSWSTGEGDPVIALRLAGALAWFWVFRGSIIEGSRWTRLALGCSAPVDAGRERGLALYAAAALAWKREEFRPAAQHIDEAISLLRPSGERRPLALALALAGLIGTSLEDPERASRLQEEALSIMRELNDPWGIAYGLSNMGDAQFKHGQFEAAGRNYLESLELFSILRDDWGRGINLLALGNVEWELGNPAAARMRYEASVDLFREMGNAENTGRGLIMLSAVALREGDPEEAEDLLLESLDLWKTYGSRGGTALCLGGMAAVLAVRGRFREAALLFGAADLQSYDQSSLYLIKADLFSPYLETTRQRLGEGTLAQLWGEGHALSRHQALSCFTVARRTWIGGRSS